MSSEGIPTKVGPYRVEAMLGAGGMGTVYRAYDERLDRRVALKQIRRDQARDPKARKRFLREARAAARLNHPAVVHVHDIVEAAGCDWIVMELVEGEALSRLLEKGALDLERGLALALEIVSGLASAHAAGILHRDLKSENVVVTAQRHAKILDFGLAKPLSSGPRPETSLSSAGGISGTPRTMSPEQAQGHEIDQRSDLFSLGILLYEMFAGRSPFRGPGPIETLVRICHQPHQPLAESSAELPRELSDLVDRLLQKLPAERPADADQVESVLRRIACSLDAETSTAAGGAAAPSRESLPAEPLASEPETATAGSRLRGEHRQVTVLCCELVGGAEAADVLDPDALYELLPDFHALATEEVRRCGGYLGHVQGQRLLIYFNYPQAQEDAARRAVFAGLEIVAGTERLGAAAELGGGRKVAARAGIHTGPAVVLAGPPADGRAPENPGTRLALGDTLDLAGDLLEHADPGGVVLSTATKNLVESDFEAKALEPFEVQGAAQPLTAHRILARRKLDPHRARPRTPRVGRRRELELLLDRLQLAREGAGQAVLLSAAAGMGKSRLVEALRDRSREGALRWIRAYGSPYPRARALYPAAEVLRQLLDLGPGTSPERQLERLEEVLREYGFPLAKTLRRIAEILEPTTRRESSAAQEREAILDTLTTVVLEVAERQPVVLAFEDVDRADAATLDWIGRLIDHGTASPLLLLLTCRPDFQAGWTHRAHLMQLHLNPLTDSEAAALLDRLLADRPPTDKARRRILARAGGVPLFVVELARQALEPGLDADRAGREIPPRLREILGARLERLGTARDVAREAAALGRRFSYADLAAISSLDAGALGQALERLVAEEIVEREGSAPPAAYAFRQILLYETARASLLAEDRQRILREVESHRVAGT